MVLAYLLAIAAALGSFALYISAFFFPEVHRKSDFYWSGLGLFYALVLWVCAGRITGAVLLGQMAKNQEAQHTISFFVSRGGENCLRNPVFSGGRRRISNQS